MMQAYWIDPFVRRIATIQIDTERIGDLALVLNCDLVGILPFGAYGDGLFVNGSGMLIPSRNQAYFGFLGNAGRMLTLGGYGLVVGHDDSGLIEPPSASLFEIFGRVSWAIHRTAEYN